MMISVVIVSWNVKELVVKCLQSLQLEGAGHELEVYVVDNASSDGGVEEICNQFPEVKVIKNLVNVGFAAANNQGIQQTHGEFILLLNPDTVMLPGSLQAMVEFLDSHSEVGAVGPMVVNIDGSLQHSCSPAPSLRWEAARLLHLPGVRSDGYYWMEAWDYGKARPVDVLLGACILIRREVLDKVGLLDESFFMYSEEVDLCYRIMKAGWLLYWVPQARILHYGGQSTQQVADEMFLKLYEGKLKFFRKHHGRLVAQLYKVILGLIAMVRLVLYRVVWAIMPMSRQKNQALATNYRRLIATLPRM